MAGYQTDYLLKLSLEAIEKHKLFFINDIVSYLPCHRATFFDHKINENPEVLKAIEKNKMDIKAGLRNKWWKGNNPLTQVVLYKLLASEEEYVRISNKPEPPKPQGNITINVVDEETKKDDDGAE